MYEGFFGLNKRPFSAIPNADSFVALEPTQEVLDDLLICLVQSRGIAVVTSFAGLGKTLLCKQVATSAENRFQTVYLSTSAFSTRRALLQAILYEFGIHYEGLSEQEARLKILEAASAIAKENRLLLIIVDEAHLLNTRLFEELRTLCDYAPEGEALVRLILSGQFELEEKLADPAMSAIHQRIGCQATLEPLSLEDSATLVKERLRIAGADSLSNVLSEPALEAICRASDGNARCLCQLADHSLLLAFAEEQKPVQRETVLAALEDLKELPLHWNELAEEELSYSSLQDSESAPILDEPEYSEVETDEFEIPEAFAQEAERAFVLHVPEQENDQFDEQHISSEATVDDPSSDESSEAEYTVFEVGADLNDPPSEEIEVPEVPAASEHHETLALRVEQDSSEEDVDNNVVEEIVVDKYAALDREQELPTEVAVAEDPIESQCAAEVDDCSEYEVSDEPIDETEILETIECLRQEIGSVVDESKARFAAHLSDDEFEESARLDVVQPAGEDSVETQENPVAETGVDHAAEVTPCISNDAFSEEESSADNLRFSQLFTRLSQRRQKLKRQRAS